MDYASYTRHEEFVQVCLNHALINETRWLYDLYRCQKSRKMELRINSSHQPTRKSSLIP